MRPGPNPRQVATEQEKQDDETLPATGWDEWELWLTYPVAPVTGVVTLALRNEVIHHDGAVSIAGCSGDGVEVLDSVQSEQHDLNTKAAFKNQLLRLLSLVIRLVALYARRVTVSSRGGLIK